MSAMDGGMTIAVDPPAAMRLERHFGVARLLVVEQAQGGGQQRSGEESVSRLAHGQIPRLVGRADEGRWGGIHDPFIRFAPSMILGQIIRQIDRPPGRFSASPEGCEQDCTPRA